MSWLVVGQSANNQFSIFLFLPILHIFQAGSLPYYYACCCWQGVGTGASGVARGGQGGARAPGATSGGR